MGEKCFDCGKELTADTRSEDTVEEQPICVECSNKRWSDFMADQA